MVNLNQKDVNCGNTITKYGYSIDGGENYIWGDDDLINPITFRNVSKGVNKSIRFKSWNGLPNIDGQYALSNISIYDALPAPVITFGKWDPKNNTLSIPFTIAKNSATPITFISYTTDGGRTWKETTVKSSPLIINTSIFTTGSKIRIAIKASNELPLGQKPKSITTTNDVYNMQNTIWSNTGFRFGLKSERSQILEWIV